MLVLTRKVGESIHVGDNIRLTVLSVQGQNVKMGINAPRNVAVHREEVYTRIIEENRLAASRASLENAQQLLDIGGFIHGEKEKDE